MKRLAKALILVSAVAICLVLPARPGTQANPDANITINITAQVAVVDDPDMVLGGAIGVGDTITGTYTYDSTNPDSNPLPTVGDYQHSSAPYGIRVNAGGFVFETDPSDVDFLVEIVNDHGDPPRDGHQLRSYNNLPLSNGATVDHIAWQLDDPTATAVSSEALPTEPPVLTDWESVFGLTLEGYDPSDPSEPDYFIRAHVTWAGKTWPTFAVDSTEDFPDITPGDGECDTGQGQCTLRAAIQEANALAGPQTIGVPAGTYELIIPGFGEDIAATGDLDITDDLTISGAGADATIIHANALDRMFHVDPSASGTIAEISGLTISNGDAHGWGGGGVRNEGTLTLAEVTVTNNRANSNGGGIFNVGTLTITDSTISENLSTANGGGIFTSVGSVLALTNSTLSGNKSYTSGGGIHNNGGIAHLQNVTIAQNRADDDGDTVGDGGGVAEAGGTVNFKNTIISDNTDNSPSAEAPDCSGTLTSHGYNLIQNPSGCTIDGDPTGNVIALDPVLGSLQDNGGSTLTHALLAGSPAIDASDNSGCPATDQRGETRPVDADSDGTPTCDMGAYEVLPIEFCLQEAEEPNDTFVEAKEIEAGIVFQGCISPAGDKDYFTHFIPAAGIEKIRVELFGLPENYDIVLYGPGRELDFLGKSDNPGIAPEMVEVELEDPGPHYVLVYGWQGAFDDVNPYYLKFSYVDPQMEALLRLQEDSLKPPEIHVDRGIPYFVDVRVPIPGSLPGDPVLQALDFLNTYRDLYRLDDPASELFLERIFTDETLGQQHLFFGQQLDGIPLWASALAVHLDPASEEVVLTGGNYLPDFSSVSTPSLPLPPPEVRAADAETTALAAVSGTDVEVLGETKLMYFNLSLVSRLPEEDETHLVWHVNLRGFRTSDGAGTSWSAFVDAHDDEVLLLLDSSQPGDRPGEDFDIETGNHDTSSSCWITTWSDDQWFDEDGPCCDYPSGGDTDGDNAFAFTHDVYHYYYDNFRRRSYDGDEEDVELYVHVGTNWGNAHYHPGCDIFEFGDSFVTRDVLAHEYTHGVTDSTSDLIYADEPGALNESYSDVFGAMVDDDDWLIGEDLPGGALRSMSHPPAFGDPDHMQAGISGDGAGLRTRTGPVECDGDEPGYNDCGYVHTNSGIPNKVAYLLGRAVPACETHHGIEVCGIGRAKTGLLYYNVLRNLPSNANFAVAWIRTVDLVRDYVERGICIGDLCYEMNDACQVINAFASVGLGMEDLNCDGVIDGEDVDWDGDGIPNYRDNCMLRNPDQRDTDGDGEGDACDYDDDGDGVCEGWGGPSNVCTAGFRDNCPLVPNPDQEDTVHPDNGIGDACDDPDGDDICDEGGLPRGRARSYGLCARGESGRDNCPDHANPWQEDTDGDGDGDPCDPDDDDDTIPDATDRCDLVADPTNSDTDGDTVGDVCDNCPATPNPDQRDDDDDGVPGTQPPPDADWGGDACDVDDDNDGVPDIEDRCPGYPDVPDLDHNGVPLFCDDWERCRLSGTCPDPDQVEGEIRFQDLMEPLRIPIFPCYADGPHCPQWLPENTRTRVEVTLPFAEMPARIVDDQGLSVRKGRLGAERTFDFRPEPEFYYEFPDLGGMTAATTLPLEEEETYQGTNYYLEIYATEDVVEGEDYPITIGVETIFGGIRCGDVDCDNDVDAVDALFVLQYVVGLRSGSDECPPPEGHLYLPAADVDCDDDVDAVDALFVLQHVVGLRPELCVCPEP